MGVIQLNVPDEHLNRLNNFYITTFGYEIHTQLLNFIDHELKKIPDDYEMKPVEPQPIPSIHYDVTRQSSPYYLEIKYPDGSKKYTRGSSYDDVLRIMNEWSKHSFSKETKIKSILKINPDDRRCIHRMKEGNKFMVRTKEGNCSKRFGNYNLEDAKIVRNFLVEKDWDPKYQPKNLIGVFEGFDKNNASEYLLKIAKGEIKYDSSQKNG